jgi:hypothetical protein
MALQGSLETVGLPDVLTLLGRAAKTGQLSIDGAKQSGAIGFRDGQIIAISTGGALQRVDAVDALFELLRIETGTFSFDGAASPSEDFDPVDVDATLAGAQSRLVEWRGIEAVVGSTEATVELVGNAVGPVTLTPEQWEMVIAIRGASKVGTALGRRAVGEFDGSKTIKGLVDAGFARIEAPSEAPLPVVTLPDSDIPARIVPTQPLHGLGSYSLTYTPASASAASWPESPILPEPEAPVELDFAPEAAAEAPTSEPGFGDIITEAGTGDLAYGSEYESAEVASLPEAGPDEDASPQPEPVAYEQVAPSSDTGGPGEALEATPEAHRDEPLNRGLLLKFLSSVRS